MEGNLKNTELNSFEAKWEVLRSAFIQTLVPEIAHESNSKSMNVNDSKVNRNQRGHRNRTVKSKDGM